LKRFVKVLFLVAMLAGIVTASASALAFDDSDFVITPDDIWHFPQPGEVGTPYFKQVRARAGFLPYKFSVLSGEMPPGLSLSSDGKVTGTPTQLGSYRFWMRLAGTGCANEFAERQFQLDVNTIRVMVTTPQLPSGSVGTPYNASLTGQGSGQLAWSVSDGSLPPGLTLGSNGAISGTPTTLGDFPLTVKLTDTGNPSRSDTKSLVVSVVEPLKLAAGPARPVAEVGRPFTTTVKATGGKAPYAWTVGELPAGLAFDQASGAVSGSPTAPGTYSIKLTVTDALATATSFELKLTVAPPVSISTRALKVAHTGRAYALKVVAAGGVRPLKWRVLGHLPAGMRFDTRAGALVGTPTTAGRARFSIRVRDALGALSTKRFTLSVR